MDFDHSRPCGSRIRANNRYTAAELTNIAKKLNLDLKDSSGKKKTIDTLCSEIKNHPSVIQAGKKSPISPRRSPTVNKRFNIRPRRSPPIKKNSPISPRPSPPIGKISPSVKKNSPIRPLPSPDVKKDLPIQKPFQPHRPPPPIPSKNNIPAIIEDFKKKVALNQVFIFAYLQVNSYWNLQKLTPKQYFFLLDYLEESEKKYNQLIQNAKNVKDIDSIYTLLCKVQTTVTAYEKNKLNENEKLAIMEYCKNNPDHCQGMSKNKDQEEKNWYNIFGFF